MAEWTTPKTDWYGVTDADGNYTGDRFNAVDFNRIKNNLQFLYDLSLMMYEAYIFNDIGDDREKGAYFYADEITAMQENLDSIAENTINRDYGESPQCTDNGAMIDYNELNRLESAILEIYGLLKNQQDGLRRFTWNFGSRNLI